MVYWPLANWEWRDGKENGSSALWLSRVWLVAWQQPWLDSIVSPEAVVELSSDSMLTTQPLKKLLPLVQEANGQSWVLTATLLKQCLFQRGAPEINTFQQKRFAVLNNM